MSVGDGSGLSPSCCVEGVGGRCLLVTQWSVSLLLCRRSWWTVSVGDAVVCLPPVVSKELVDGVCW